MIFETREIIANLVYITPNIEMMFYTIWIYLVI